MGVLLLFREAVSLFYGPSRLRHRGKPVDSWLHCFYQIKTTRRTLLYWNPFTPVKARTQYFHIGLALGINCQNVWGLGERLRYRSPFSRLSRLSRLLRLSIRNRFKSVKLQSLRVMSEKTTSALLSPREYTVYKVKPTFGSLTLWQVLSGGRQRQILYFL